MSWLKWSQPPFEVHMTPIKLVVMILLAVGCIISVLTSHGTEPFDMYLRSAVIFLTITAEVVLLMSKDRWPV
jgi:hypothetical protein